jgi:alcohol dehydrogenase class IV
MTARFEFASAGRIIFGAGSIKELGSAAKNLGHRALIVTGRTARHADSILAQLASAGLTGFVFSVAGEPDTQTIEKGVARAKAEGVDLIIGIGGGSSIDTAKAIAAIAANDGSLLDYLEVAGRGQPLQKAALSCIAIPTTAGTGSEVTRNAVIASPEHRVKASIRHVSMLPRVALVDPRLTLDLPPLQTACTGMDALTQLLEAYICSRSNPITDGFCREGLARAARSLKTAFKNGQDLAAREDLSLAALLSGLALANSGLGAVHGLAGPLGGMFNASHGALCAALLPHVMAVNLDALSSRAPNCLALQRFGEIAQILTRNSSATAADAAVWTAEAARELSIPSLSHYGVAAGHFEELASKAGAASSMKANPVILSHTEIIEILRRAL